VEEKKAMEVEKIADKGNADLITLFSNLFVTHRARLNKLWA
jgi:hypothetical protein